jgi:serine/threonine protein kinase
LCELGKGGMGVVFKAEKVDDGAIYAVKMLNKMVLRNTQVEIKDMLAEIEL